MLKESNWSVKSHYILYPNPYPKAKHLGRRWYGHPVFPYLLALGGVIRVRSNWEVYCQEMKLAVDIGLSYFPAAIFGATQVDMGQYCYARQFPTNDLDLVSDERFQPPHMSHFERKYMHLGVPLFETVTYLPVLDARTRRANLRHLLLDS